jgi:predicted DNA repair protein MutK
MIQTSAFFCVEVLRFSIQPGHSYRMASGLAALLDDVAAIAKLAAASLDDVTAAAGKAGSKAIGVVVDDAAVTPGYAMGFTPERELPIVWKIALGSLRNKFLFLLPGALLLSAFAPWAVTPILMLGGAYLCFEATEKIIEAVGKTSGKIDKAPHVEELALSSAEMEAQKVSGAIRTDLILSGEIMAIALATVADRPFPIQAGALVVVSLLITFGVYGVVGLIVKMDDIGVHLAERSSSAVSAFGRGLVKAMPQLLKGLAFIGTAAMLWVGGGIMACKTSQRWARLPLGSYSRQDPQSSASLSGALSSLPCTSFRSAAT